MKYCYGEFTDVNGIDWTINIYKEGYNGEATKLLLGDSPLVIEYVSDNPFKPVKYSGCSIKVLTPTILSELFTGKILDVKIEILKNNVLYWEGYNSPNIYNQEYWSNLDEMTIEGIDCLAATQYFKWKDIEITDSTFLDQIRTVLNKVYTVQPDIYYFNNIGMLADFKNITSNWSKEDEDSMDLNAVLESICTFLGVQMFQKANQVWMVGNNRGDGIIYKSDGTTESTYYDFDAKVLTVAENDSNISYGDTYNQISVIGNIVDTEDNVMNFDSGDNEHLEILNDYCWQNTFKNENSDDYNKIFSTYAMRDDVEMNPVSYNESTNYPVLQVCPEVSFERWGTIKYDFADKFAEQNTTLSFKNNIVFQPRQECYVDFTTWTPYNNLLIMHNTLTQPNYSILHYESPKRLFRAGDYLMLSCGLYYTSQYSSGININKGVTRTIDGNTYVDNRDVVLINDFVTGIVPFGIRTKIKINGKYLSKTYTGSTWETTESYADFIGKAVKNGESANNTFKLACNPQFSNMINSSTEGYAIEIPETFYGSLEFDLISAVARPFNQDEVDYLKQQGIVGSGYKSQLWSNNDQSKSIINFVHIEDLNIRYITKDYKQFWDLERTEEDKDLRYEAEISDDNINNFSDLTLNLNTYNPLIYDKLSNSYVLDSNNEFVNRVLGGAYYCRPEQHLVRKYVDYYKEPKKIYTNTYNLTDILPYDYFTTDYLDNQYLVGNMQIDAKYNTVNITGYEV